MQSCSPAVTPMMTVPPRVGMHIRATARLAWSMPATHVMPISSSHTRHPGCCSAQHQHQQPLVCGCCSLATPHNPAAYTRNAQPRQKKTSTAPGQLQPFNPTDAMLHPPCCLRHSHSLASPRKASTSPKTDAGMDGATWQTGFNTGGSPDRPAHCFSLTRIAAQPAAGQPHNHVLQQPTGAACQAG